MRSIVCLFLLFWFADSFSQETLKNIDSVLMELKIMREDTSKVVLLQKIAGHYNVTSLDSSKAFSLQGIKLAEKLKFDKGKWMNLSTLGNYYERKSTYDSAMVYYNRALNIVERTNDTKGFAIVLNNIALVDTRRGEYNKALIGYFDALKAEEEIDNKNGIAQAYNNIGVVYYYTGNFDKTTEYLTKGLQLQEEMGNLDGLQNGYNNVGAIYDYQKKHREAIASYQKALDIAIQLKDIKQQASYLSNIALSYSQMGEYKTAESYFLESNKIREETKDYNGMAHGYLGFGQMLLRQKKLKDSKNYIERAIELSIQYGAKVTLKEAYAAMAEIATEENNYKLANQYIYDYMKVKDSIINEKNAEIMAEVEAKYETEKKENQILQQRAQLAEKDLEVRRKNTLLYGSIGLALLLAVLGYLLYNQQKLKNRQFRKESELKTALAKIETQNKLQEQRLRISRDLHDNIGAQLTFIISSLDNLKYGFPEMQDKLAAKLTGISKFTSQTIYELRDTIWAMNKGRISFEDLQARISNFIEKAQLASREMDFSFEIAEGVNTQYTFTSVQGMNVYRIIQEAVNNSLKYAQASEIEVSISEEKNRYVITIEDNGKGFDINAAEMGNGLNNMKKRSRDIQGELSINSANDSGTEILLKVPK